MKNIYGIVFLIISISSYAQNALNFDGINDYVQAANAGPAGSSSRTVELWVNPSYIPSTQTVFVDWGAMALGNRFTLNMINGTPRIEIGGSGLNATTSITVGNWYHIAATFDNGASTKYKIYVNAK